MSNYWQLCIAYANRWWYNFVNIFSIEACIPKCCKYFKPQYVYKARHQSLKLALSPPRLRICTKLASSNRLDRTTDRISILRYLGAQLIFYNSDDQWITKAWLQLKYLEHTRIVKYGCTCFSCQNDDFVNLILNTCEGICVSWKCNKGKSWTTKCILTIIRHKNKLNRKSIERRTDHEVEWIQEIF